VRASLEGDWKPPTRFLRATCLLGGASPGLEGCGPPGRESQSTDEGSCLDLRVQAGGGSEVQGRESSGGARTPRRASAGRSGQLDAVVNGLDEGRKASKQVKLAERGGSAGRCPGRPGSGLRSAERESIVPGGTRQLRASVGVGETRGERRRAARLSTLVDDCKGAGSPERGRRSSRGESSEGRDPRDGSGMQQGRKARVC